MNAIEALKAIDRREMLYLVMKDAEAKRVLVAWTIYGGVRAKHHEIDPEKMSVGQIIEAAWFGADAIDPELLGRLAGLSPRMAGQKMMALQNYALVYPDGTVNEKALALIRAEVGAHIRGLAG